MQFTTDNFEQCWCSVRTSSDGHLGGYFSKWLDAIPVRNQEAYTIAKAFVNRIVSIFWHTITIIY